MQNVNISEFRSNLLKYLEKARSGEQITVTSNGKRLATISPPMDQRSLARDQLNDIASTAKINDVITPVDHGWDALQ